ncbi:DUF1972 domain-containing protein [Nocardioides zeae]|uniref:Glycosyltransferase involved in cell wall biosynthesis n=1 Tax=Nocardioides zeae TaxID=1457234 RepID=A0AAJ1U2E8_9ACTN|nr:glycosyltransferase [Nocardioides zeae]MDQ1106750.1 glycosyltransferase involved in cell wall biosynthesis [Nocardioides zeae]
MGTKPLRVAIIGTRGYPSYYGGFETAVRRIAPAFADQGWDVTVYGRPGSTKPDDPANDPRVKPVETKGLNRNALSTLTYGLTAVLHAIAKRQQVALIMNVANGYWLPLLKLFRIPTVVNVDGIEWERAKWSKLGKRVFYTGAKLTARFADELIFDAEAIGDYWAREFNRTGTFIPYGGDEVGRLPCPDMVRSGEYVLVVARFVPENSVGEFFDAADELSRENSVVVLGTGSPELEARARELSERHEKFKWLGHVSNDQLLHGLWQHAGAYFHGHSVGGTNPALVQAMACGAPIVARNTVYNAEVLAGAATLVEPDPRQIASAAASLLASADRRLSVSRAVRARAAERYTWSEVVDLYIETVATTVRVSRD